MRDRAKWLNWLPAVVAAVAAAWSPQVSRAQCIGNCCGACDTSGDFCNEDLDCPMGETCIGRCSHNDAPCLTNGACGGANVCIFPNGAGTYTSSDGKVITVAGGQVSGAGATLFVDFFLLPASTNDWIDVDNDGITGFSLSNPFPFVDQLAAEYTVGMAPPLPTHWMFQYRSVGSVNGFNEFVQNQLCEDINSSIPGEAGIFNQFRYANGGAVTSGGGANGSGTRVVPCEIEFSFLDVPSKWAVRVPEQMAGDAKWRTRPTTSGYGSNPILSSTGYDSRLQPLSRDCGAGDVFLNQNTATPDEDTIFDFVGAWVPVSYIANRGTGLQNIRLTEAQHMFATGRMPNGENLMVVTRSVGSGTRNAIMNSSGIDTSWGRGDNLNNENASSTNFNLGPATQPTNCEGSSQMEVAVTSRRLGVGYTGLAGGSRSAADSLAGQYEILNLCKDVDENQVPIPNACSPLPCQRTCDLISIPCDDDSDCQNAIPFAGNTCLAAGGYVRPGVNSVVNNCDPACAYQIGGNGSFVTRGNPNANRDPMDPKFEMSQPLDNQAVADYINNISDSVDSFTGTTFPGLCQSTEVCSVRRCSLNMSIICTSDSNCSGGNGTCDFIACENDADCAAGSNGTCGLKPCTTDPNCGDKVCQAPVGAGIADNCTIDGDCPTGAQTCVTGFCYLNPATACAMDSECQALDGADVCLQGQCSIDGLVCTMDGDCANIGSNACLQDYCQLRQNMPGELLSTIFFLPAGLDCQQSLDNGVEFTPTVPLNQTLQDFMLANNTLDIGQDTPAFGTANAAGRRPIRNTVAGHVYSDGQASNFLTHNGVSFVDFTSSTLPASMRIQGDFDGDTARDIDDAQELVDAYHTPRAWQIANGNKIPELIGDFNGDGSLTKEDLRYFADGLALDSSPLAGGNPGQLNRKQGSIDIDAALIAEGLPLPWADGRRQLLVPPTPGMEPTFQTPTSITQFLANPLATYSNGDFRADVAGGHLQACTNSLCELDRNSCTRDLCSDGVTGCATDMDCPLGFTCTYSTDCARTKPASGADPRGWDGRVDGRDIDYVCGNILNWADLDEAVFMDLSADIDGDLDVDSTDVAEVVQTILETDFGDADLDGDVDNDDIQIVQDTINLVNLCNVCSVTTSTACDEDSDCPMGETCDRCGWEDGDFNCDFVVNALDLAFVLPIQPPQAAIGVHAARKNRFISFIPANSSAVNFRVRELSSGRVQWVAAPTGATDIANNVSRLVGDGTDGTRPAARVWTEQVIHVTECLVSPVRNYEVEALADGSSIATVPLAVGTILQPGAKFWADTNGPFLAGAWTGPDLLVNFTDVSAAVQAFQNVATKPHVTWVDLVAIAFPGNPNLAVNFADINGIINGFQGNPYPGTAPVDCP